MFAQFLFATEAILVSLLCDRLLKARRRVEESADEARELERRILEISDAEQRRIGHDLHDGLGQHLTGIALMSKRLEQRLSATASPQAEEAIQITALARAAVEWTHDLCRSLSPTVLETRGLQDALHELTTNAETIFGIDCSFEQNGDAGLPSTDLAAAMHLYRIAQEAISNAVKHGKARHVSVSLARKGEEIDMMITDDGVGVAQSQNGLEDGMGLRIMRYRARMIGARIDVRRGNGEAAGNGTGTIVTCRYRPGRPSPGNEA
jgi:signal transduction histidine kinase